MISELENGRLAMLAFVVQVGLELVTEKSILQQWQEVFGIVNEVKETVSNS